MVASERGRNPTQPQVSAQDLFVAARADSFLPAGVFWVSERSPEISTYPLGFGGEWFCSGPPSHLSVYTGTRLYMWSLYPRYRIVGMLGIPLPDFSLGSH